MLWTIILLTDVATAAEVEAELATLELAGVLIFLGASLAFAIHFAGGGLSIPVLILLCGLSAKEAIPVSNTIIFGGSVALLLFNCSKKLPPDYYTAVVLQPWMLLGSFIGVLLNQLLSDSIILGLVCVFLKLGVIRAACRSLSLFRKENEFPSQVAEDDSAERNDDLTPDEGEARKDSYQLSTAERPQTHGFAIFLSLCNFGMLVFVAFGTGSSYWSSFLGTVPCSVNFFLLCGGYAACVLVSCVLAVKVCQSGRSFTHPVKCCGVAWFGGICTGILGIGGGIFISPLLSKLGYQSQVVMTTSAYLMVFTSAGTIVQFALLEKVDWLASGSLGLASLLGALAGLALLSQLVAMCRRASLIAFTLTGLNTVGLVVLFITKFEELTRVSLVFEVACGN